MGANIITGYTGTRHITPAMDAAVYRSTFGPDSYILSDGNQLAGSMPSVNEFTVLDGLVSMQGHQIQVTQETLSVDTCANGYKRIDLVCMRFEHDNNTQIDSASLIVIKGTEVADPNDPVVPSYNTGDIDSGASVVDMPLYQIDLAGSSVTFSQTAEVMTSTLVDTGRCAKQIYALNYASFYNAIMALNIADSFSFRLEADCVKTLTNNKVTLAATGIGSKGSSTPRIDIIFQTGGSALYSARIDMSQNSATIVALYRATMTSV